MGVRKGGVVGIKEGGAREGEGREGDTQSITNRSSRVYPTFLVVTVSVSKVGRVVRLRRHASLFPSYPSPTFPLSLSFPLQLFNYPSMPKDSSAWLFTANVPFESFLLVEEKKKRGQEWGTEIIASSLSYRRIFPFSLPSYTFISAKLIRSFDSVKEIGV